MVLPRCDPQLVDHRTHLGGARQLGHPGVDRHWHSSERHSYCTCTAGVLARVSRACATPHARSPRDHRAALPPQRATRRGVGNGHRCRPAPTRSRRHRHRRRHRPPRAHHPLRRRCADRRLRPPRPTYRSPSRCSRGQRLAATPTRHPAGAAWHAPGRCGTHLRRVVEPVPADGAVGLGARRHHHDAALLSPQRWKPVNHRSPRLITAAPATILLAFAARQTTESVAP